MTSSSLDIHCRRKSAHPPLGSNGQFYPQQNQLLSATSSKSCRKSESDSIRENTQEGRKSITLVSPISGSLPGMLHSYGSMHYPSRQPLALEWLRKTDRNNL